jgi:hypothetical protein
MRTLPGAMKLGAAACALIVLVQCAPAGEHARSGASRSFAFPTTGVEADGQALLLAIDDHLLPVRENVSIYLSKPAVRKEPVLTPSKDDPKAPDQLATHFYGTVLHDQGKYRMWYYACYLDDPAKQAKGDPTYLHQGPVCYAESDDGIRWTKPNLGQAEIKGSKDNNAILLPDERIETVNLIKPDDRGDRRSAVHSAAGVLGRPERQVRQGERARLLGCLPGRRPRGPRRQDRPVPCTDEEGGERRSAALRRLSALPVRLSPQDVRTRRSGNERGPVCEPQLPGVFPPQGLTLTSRA